MTFTPVFHFLEVFRHARQSIICMDKLADAQKNQNFNDFNIQLASARVFEKKWEMLNFDEDHLLSN